MRRGRTVVRRRDLEGSERSHGLAAALAETCSPEFLEALVHGVAQLDSIGGQLFIASVRNKYAKTTITDPTSGAVLGESWDRLDDYRAPGDYETDGYLIYWEHIATALRDARKEPDTEKPVPRREEVSLPEPEEDLWDQQHAELDKEPEEEPTLASVGASAFADDADDPAEDHPDD